MRLHSWGLLPFSFHSYGYDAAKCLSSYGEHTVALPFQKGHDSLEAHQPCWSVLASPHLFQHHVSAVWPIFMILHWFIFLWLLAGCSSFDFTWLSPSFCRLSGPVFSVLDSSLDLITGTSYICCTASSLNLCCWFSPFKWLICPFCLSICKQKSLSFYLIFLDFWKKYNFGFGLS